MLSGRKYLFSEKQILLLQKMLQEKFIITSCQLIISSTELKTQSFKNLYPEIKLHNTRTSHTRISLNT